MRISILTVFYLFTLLFLNALAQNTTIDTSLDQSIEIFLDQYKNSWRDMNIPAADGKVLYDLIIKNNYTRALEIGTSTGHSAIWITWALSKTGGN